MYKKIVVTSLLIAGIVFCSSAQVGLRIGLNAGPTFSRAGTSLDSLPNNFKIKTKIGYTFGLQIHYGFSDVMGIETGLQYVSKGYSIENDTNKVKDIFKSTVNDFEIPLCFTLRQQLNSYSYMREKVGVSLGMHTEKQEIKNING